MSLVTLGIWLLALVAFLGAGVAFLPDGSDWPFPSQIGTATETLYIWLYTFNSIFPVDTLVQILIYGVAIDIFTRFLWPSIMFVFRRITGSVNQ